MASQASPNWNAIANANGNHITFLAVKGSGSIWLHAERYRHVTPDQVYSVVGRSTNYLAYVNGQLPSVAAVKARLAYEVYPTSYDGGLIGGPAQGRGLLGGIKNFLSGGLIVNTIIRAGCDMVRSVSSGIPL